jgi:hypothetical protein
MLDFEKIVATKNLSKDQSKFGYITTAKTATQFKIEFSPKAVANLGLSDSTQSVTKYVLFVPNYQIAGNVAIDVRNESASIDVVISGTKTKKVKGSKFNHSVKPANIASKVQYEMLHSFFDMEEGTKLYLTLRHDTKEKTYYALTLEETLEIIDTATTTITDLNTVSE